jgi:hypothetical protein
MMTTKERLACGVGLLNSIDARRHRSNNPGTFLAVEQAIVDRELFELEAHCSERIALGWNRNNRASKSCRGNSGAKSPESRNAASLTHSSLL